MFSIIIYVFFILIFIAVPLPAQLVMLVIDFFVPDPIPALDELIMVLALLKKISTAARIWEFLDEHPWLKTVLKIALVAAIVVFVKYIFFK